MFQEKEIGGTKRKNNARARNIELKKEKLLDAANNLLSYRTEIHAFGVYVGKKMEEILVDQQRDLAEKLISEIMFLAKTNNLTFDTRVEIPSRRRLHDFSSHNTAQSYFVQSPPSTSSNSYEYIQTESPTSPFPHTQNPSPASSHSYQVCQPASSPIPNRPIPIQSPTSTFPHTQPASPASFHSYQVSLPLNSPIPNHPIPIQSPTSPSPHEQHASSASSHSYLIFPNSSDITRPNSTPSSENAVNVTENTVYIEGPTKEILKELLVFRKRK